MRECYAPLQTTAFPGWSVKVVQRFAVDMEADGRFEGLLEVDNVG